MSEIVLRLIRGWYDPAVQEQRELRTSVARTKAIAVRIRAEGVDRKVQQTHQSYIRAGKRISQSQSGGIRR